MKIIDSILNLIFPPKCIFCGELLDDSIDDGVCASCYESLEFIGEDYFSEDFWQFSFKQNFSLLFYNDMVGDMIKRLKYDNHPEYAKPLANLVAKNINCNVLPKADFIIPVPLHKKRMRERGYNQSELLAGEFSKLFNIPMRSDILKRIKNTTPQYGLTKKQRMENITGAFAVENAEIVKNKTILLVDDIFTTGATIDNCSKELLQNGAAAVYSITPAFTEFKQI